MATKEKAAPAATGTASVTASDKVNHISPLATGQCAQGLELSSIGISKFPRSGFKRHGGDE